MASVTLAEVLHKIRQLPRSDRQKFRAILRDSLKDQAGRELGKRVAPLVPDYRGSREMNGWLNIAAITRRKV